MATWTLADHHKAYANVMVQSFFLDMSTKA